MAYVARLQLEKCTAITIWVLLKMIGQECEFSCQNLRQGHPHSQLLEFGRCNRRLGSSGQLIPRLLGATCAHELIDTDA